MTSGENVSEKPSEKPVLYREKFFVPFHLADPVGVLFFGNFFQVAHQAYERWARQVAGVWSAWFGNTIVGHPLRHCEADYFKFLRVGGEYELRVRCASMSESTFILVCEFWSSEGCHATVRTIHTAVDLVSKSKATIAPVLREFFSTTAI